MIAAVRSSGWAPMALLATAVATVVWAVLAVYSAAGRHISSTAEDVAFVTAILAGVALIVAGISGSLSGSGRGAGWVLAAGGVAALVITYFFSPTTW